MSRWMERSESVSNLLEKQSRVYEERRNALEKAVDSDKAAIFRNFKRLKYVAVTSRQ